MGLFSFIQDAGAKLFGSDDPAEVSAKIKSHLEEQLLGLHQLEADYNPETKTVILTGIAPDLPASEKAALAAGNVSGVKHVDNRLKLLVQVAAEAAARREAAEAEGGAPSAAENAEAAAATESRFHDVVKGDTLSAIAKQYYGDANQYNKIFEANKPMLTDPNKIYPGQKLRIPD
ncbi:peptidoglycan-binding protein LysM [Conchiformibius steedae DSM 2580]|uniref:Potassium binding protein Kbp n=1 Tax=Conchiformibius steedae DSM 2580 TaxID=1121352 RepID=A0AAE9L0Z6_9NEIS|nr:peptidoglycan-binding protein LysM [Conchiformibius steedae]QMT33674.1 peptidoglycan-binding protein LysM [Conchiformibius steedae]URD68335.1 peptidoglycan-binding protein LysM [Conchiformibius steedae DSM 2580]